MAGDPLLARFVAVFQSMADDLRAEIDGTEHAVDPGLAPRPFLPWLGGWLGLDAPGPSMPERRHRALVRAAARSLGQRGTARALEAELAAATGGRVRVADDGGVWREGEGRPCLGRVRVELATSGTLTPSELRAVIDAHLPAHAGVEVLVAGERLEFPWRAR
jgi:phage tail-like protein